MKDCLFCSIAASPDKLIWENEGFAAFNDIHPKAKVHVLIVPKAHVATLDDLDAVARGGALVQAIQEVARFLGVPRAYRAQINVGKPGGQEVDHLHVHLLAD